MGETFAPSVASNLVSKLLERLFAPIGRQFGYVLCYKSLVKDLNNGVEKLETRRERVQHSVQEAENNGKPIENDIKKWLESVENEATQAQILLKDGESARDACFRGWLPNPAVRYPIGRKVKKMTKVIQGLHEESQNNDFLKVYYENPPIGIVTATTSTARSAHRKEDVLESRASIMEDVIKAITDDKVCVIGVYGPGGVGKSKLMEDIEWRLMEEQIFDVVAITNVSRNPDLKNIQGEIAYALGLNLLNQETTRARADILCKMLEKHSEKRVLIVLDNLWTKLELKEVGIPYGYDNKVRGCKLLLTSRYRHVLYTDMCSDREFQLNELKHGEACVLFERTVGDKVNDPQFKSLVDGVVGNCGGLPLLIISLAKRLKRGDLHEWRDASTNSLGSDAKSIVTLNYNDLKDERVQSLFLVRALYSGRLSVRDTLIYCMGLGLFKTIGRTIENARDRLIRDLRHLLNSSLLQGSDDLKQLSMHDLFVDVAISMHEKFIDTEWNALVGTKDYGFKEWSKQDLRKCTAMAFDYVGINELPEELYCPSLRILLISERNPYLKMPESFFESMEKLQVLDLTSLSFTSLPSSMEFLENLKSLCLDQCHLEDVTALGKLKGLQFLSFCYSTIARLPKEMGELTELRFLDLRECPMLEVIEPGVLESMVNLEELNMQNSFDQWEAKDKTPRSNASLAEFKNMKKLSTLYIAIPHSTNLSRDLPFGKLNKHKILIGDGWDWSDQYEESRTLKLKLHLGNLLHEEWMQRCLHRTQYLHLAGLRDNHSIHDLCFEGFPELKHLYVQNSPSVHYIVHSTEDIQCTAFTRLESLFLKNLNNLEKICHDRLDLGSFSELKTVKLDNCGEIKYLFPSSMMRICLQLEDIEISRCHLIKQVVADVEADEDRDEIDVDPKVKSRNLRWLTLRNLPEMISFYKIMDHSVVLFDRQLLIKLQNLEAITVDKCQSIQQIFDLEEMTDNGDVEILCQLTSLTLSGLPSLECIWNGNPRRALCFRNLKALIVQNCENLRFIFSSSMAKALVQIKEIKIANCALVEEIMYVQEEGLEEDTTADTLKFPLLTSLSLVELPNLKTFSRGKYCIHYPSLTRLTISRCPKMITFSSFEGRQQSLIDDTGLQRALDCINSGLSLPSFFNEKVLFPSLEELKLSSMCQLKRIWHNQLHGQSSKLASLTVELCENLSHVFASNSMDMLQSLNKIKAIGCPSLEALFEPISLGAEKRQKPLVLPALKEMTLSNLSRLRDIFKSDCEATLAFPSLMEVNVRGCHSLPYLFSSATAKALDKLVVLDVSCCNYLRGIIVMEEGEGKTLETLKFRQLSTLKLGDLENLISFRSASCAGDGLHPLFDEKVGFPAIESMEISQIPNVEKIWVDELASDAFSKLKTLRVDHCEKLASIFSSDIILARLRNLEELNVTDCGSLEVVFQVDKINMSGAHTTSSFRLRQLNLERLPKMKHVWSGHPNGTLKFERLQCLKATECESLQSLFPNSVAKSMTQLEQLLVSSCGVEEIIAEEDGVDMSASHPFPQLSDLRLLGLPNLRSFYRNSHTSTLPILKQLRVRHCGKMRSFSFDCEIQSCHSSTTSDQRALFSFEKVIPNLEGLTLTREDVMTMMQQHYIFDNLEELELACYHDEHVAFPSDFLLHRFPHVEVLSLSCSSLEEIFPEDVFGHGGATPYGELIDMETPLGALRNLKRLELNKLCKLQQVWKDGSLMAEILKQIESLLVSECSSLSIIFPSPIAFHGLTELEVKGCTGLVHMGTCSAMPSLVHLARLILRDCGKMEDVVTDDGNEAEEISFPELEELILDGLPSLESFSSTNCAFRFPSLGWVIVKQCPKMNIFCNGALSTPNLDEVFLSNKYDERRWEGDLNTTIQSLST